MQTGVSVDTTDLKRRLDAVEAKVESLTLATVLPMNRRRIIELGAARSRNDAVTLGQVEDMIETLRKEFAVDVDTLRRRTT
jgi:hypothetical protein